MSALAMQHSLFRFGGKAKFMCVGAAMEVETNPGTMSSVSYVNAFDFTKTDLKIGHYRVYILVVMAFGDLDALLCC